MTEEMTIGAENREHADIPRDGFFQGFDGLRAIAALLVVLVHVSILSGYGGATLTPFLAQTDIGVPVFLVISGFLLYRPFVVARLAAKEPIGFGEFWKRRALRIFPAYWFCLAVVSAFMYDGTRGIDSVPTFLEHFFLLHVYDSSRAIGGPVQQSWTLAVEVSFYAFLPIYAWCICRIGTRRSPIQVEIAGVATLYAISLVYRIVLLSMNVSDSQFGQFRIFLPGFLDQLALGMGLAVASAWLAQRGDRDVRAPRWLAGVAWALAALCFVVVAKGLNLPTNPIAHRTDSQYLLEQFFRGTAAALFVMPAVFAATRRGAIRRFLSARVMVWLGLISYGIYLWHEAWLTIYLRWVGFAYGGNDRLLQFLGVTLALTIPTAALSYYLIERPALRLKTKTRRITARQPA